MDAIKYGVASNIMSDEEFSNFLNGLNRFDINVVWSDINHAIRSEDAFVDEEMRNVWKKRLNMVNRLMDRLDEEALDMDEEEELNDDELDARKASYQQMLQQKKMLLQQKKQKELEQQETNHSSR